MPRGLQLLQTRLTTHRFGFPRMGVVAALAVLLCISLVPLSPSAAAAPSVNPEAWKPNSQKIADGIGTTANTGGSANAPAPVAGSVGTTSPGTPIGKGPDAPGATTGKTSSPAPAELPKDGGFVEGKSHELPAERSATTRVFENPDGTKTAQLYTDAVNIQDDKGKWQDVDPTLEKKSGRINSKRTHVKTSYAQKGDDAALETLNFPDGSSVSYSLRGSRSVVPTVDGKKALYNGILPSVDLSYTTQDSGVKEDLILRDGTTPDSYTWDVALHGVTATYDKPSGDVIFINGKGQESGRLTHGWMEDANVDPQAHQGALSDGISYSIDSTSKNKATITMHLDTTWLRDPARVFPVDVDPTSWTSVNGIADDTFVMSGFTADSAGLGIMKIGTYDGGAHVGAGYVKFDVSSLAGARVVGTRYSAYNSYSWSCNARGLGVYPVTQAWGGHTMTGFPGATYDANNKVMWAPFAMGYNSSCPSGWAYWDNAVNGMVQGWIDGTVPNFGFTLRVDPGSENDNFAYKYFNTSETGGQHLDVTYISYNAQYSPASNFNVIPHNNSAGSINVNVRNTGQQCWDANGTNRLSYHLYDGAGNLIRWDNARTFLPQQVCPGQTVTLNATVDAIPPGQYRMDWDMVNEGNYWFSDGGLVPVVQQPFFTANMTPNLVNNSAQPANLTVLSVNNTTLSVAANDPDAWPSALAYQFKICKDVAMTAGCTSQSSTASSWAPPSMYWNQPYYWTVNVSDGANTSATAGPLELVARVTQPVQGAHFGGDAYSPASDGANMATGNYVASFTDLSIPGVGPTLEVDRTYNSLDPTSGPLGTGWSSVYASHLIVESGGTILLTYPDGRQGRFGLNPDGTYIGPSGYFSQIITASGVVAYKLLDSASNSFNYDPSGRLVSITSPEGIVLNLTYDGSGHLSTVQNATNQRKLTYAWTGSHVTAISSDAPATGGSPLTWTYGYTGNDLTSVCNPNTTNNCTTYRYTSLAGRDLLTQVVLPRGNISETLHYNSSGVLDSRTDGMNKTWAYAVSTDGSGNRVATVTDPLSHATTYTYDSLGRLISTKDAQNYTKSFVYNDAGFLAKETDANGNAIQLNTDGSGNVLSRTIKRNGAYYTSYYSYFQGGPGDARNGKITEFRDARSSSATDNTYLTTYSYNIAGKQTSLHTPATGDFSSGRTTTWSYAAGTEATIDNVGTTPVGVLLSMTDPTGAVTAYTYDSKGNQRRTTDPLGLRKDFTFDNLGRKLTQNEISDSYPSGLVTSYTYDGLNNVLTETEPAANDALLGSARQPKTTYTYDANGNVSTVVVSDATAHDASRTTTFDYDNDDRSTAVHNAGGGVQSATYDAAGNVATSTSPLGVVTAYAYSPRNQLTTTTVKSFVDDPIAGSTARDVTVDTRTYDPAGRLDREMDANGRTTQFQYFEDDSLANVILLGFHNADGTTRNITQHAYSYDPAGNETQVINNGIQKITNSYNAANEITHTVLDPGGVNRTIDYTHDGNGNVARQTTGQGSFWSQTWFYYNPANELNETNVVNQTGNIITSYGHDKRGYLTAVIDPRANVSGGVAANYRTTYSYDELGRQTSTTSPPVNVDNMGQSTTTANLTTKAAYDTFGNLIASQKPIAANGTTSYTYDPLNHLLTTSQPTTCCGGSAITTAYTYDTDGNRKTAKDPRGNVASFDYDKRGRLVRETDPLIGGQTVAGTQRFAYDDMGNTVKTTNQVGSVTDATYDDLNRPRTTTVEERTPSSALYKSTYTYDDMGNKTSITDPAGDVSKSVYNAAGDMTSKTDPLGKVSYYQYDGNDHVTLTYSPTWQENDYAYDQAGRMTQVDSFSRDYSADHITKYAYDQANNVTSETDPNGNVITSQYDALNRTTQFTQPVSATKSITTKFGYDADSNRTFVTDAGGNTTWSTFNALDLTASVVEPSTTAYPNASDRTWTNTYDAVGNLTQQVKPGAVTVANVYDSLNRPTSSTATGGDVGTQTKTFGYDLASNLKTMSVPGGTQSFTLNDRGLITGQSGPLGSATFTYNGANELTSRVDAAGTTNYTYNARGQVATASDPLVGGTYAFYYDDEGHLDGENVGSTWTIHDYDDWSRPTKDTIGNTSGTNWRAVAYGYDNDSNVTSKTFTYGSGGTTETNSFTYDKANRMLSSTKNGVATNYAWSDSGNRTQNGTATATFDARNRLLNDGTNSYTYSARGTLQGQTVLASSTTTNYKFDGFDRMAYDPTDSSMSTTNGLTYDALDRLVARNGTTMSYDGTSSNIVNDGAFKYTYRNDVPLSEKTGTTAFAAEVDAHGDVVGSYTPSGSVTANRTSYDPFGKISATAGTQATLGYQGSWTNQNSSQKHADAQSRWYLPDQSRFASRDQTNVPMSSAVDANRYTYGSDNPLTYSDPSGRSATMALEGLLGGELAGTEELGPVAWAVTGGTALLVGGSIVYDHITSNSGTVAQSNTITSAPATTNTYAGDTTSSVATPTFSHTATTPTASATKHATQVVHHAPPRPRFVPKMAPPQSLGAPPIDIATLQGPITGPAIDATITQDEVQTYVGSDAAADAACGQTMTCFAPSTAVANVNAQLTGADSIFPNFRPENTGTCAAISTTANVLGLFAMSGIGGDRSDSTLNSLNQAFSLGQTMCTASEQSQPSGKDDSKSKMTSSDSTGGGREYNGEDILFGQKRIGPNFSSGGNFKGASIEEVAAMLKNKELHPDSFEITAFEHEGQLVTVNNRSLATLSLAGLRPTNVTIKSVESILENPREDIIDRLNETPLLPGGTLPGREIPVTPSQKDLNILYIIRLPD